MDFTELRQKLGSFSIPGFWCLLALSVGAISAPANASIQTPNPVLAAPQDAYDQVIAELYDEELAEFRSFYDSLTSDGVRVFTRMIAQLDEGQRGTMGLLLARADKTPASRFLNLFNSFDDAEFAKVARSFKLRDYDDWEAAITLLSYETAKDTRAEFLQDESYQCHAPDMPDQNSDLEGETDSGPHLQLCSENIIQFRKAFFPTTRRVTRGVDLRLDTAPWQGQVSLFGPSTKAYHGASARADQVKQFGRALKDWEINHTCGAVYIGDRFLLTAAHCVYSKTLSNKRFFDGRRIRLGSHRVDNLDNLIPIRTVITHRDYDSKTLRNDIALIELVSEPRMQQVRRAKLPPSARFVPRPGRLMLSGWGYVRRTASSSNARGLDGQFQYRAFDRLQGGLLDLYAPNICNNNRVFRANRLRIRPGQLCAGTKTGIDSCRGDSGGPLVDLRTDTLVGLVSGGKGCGIIGTPSVYVDVAHYLDWIAKAKALARRSSAKTRRTYPAS
ncbi:serine protease [Erythrobacter sp. F6033]|uniref:S1 family serine peptidase n=1 Tax=Erythrobacter sp. F6033 TaxID=2926401 RepID=UPI001FF182A8|nr:serine protease [Erythrobacter sp. F6033]MCK0128653.1 serine protease [Erythrobacter sp. F6033]